MTRRRKAPGIRRAAAIMIAAAGVAAITTAHAESRTHAGAFAEVAQLIEEQRFTEAEAGIKRLIAANPDDPATLVLDGNLRFLLGDYDGAAENLNRVRQLGGREAERDDWRFLTNLVTGTREATKGYVEAKSPEGHFLIRHAPGRDELLLPYAFATLEAARREIAIHDFEAGALLADPIRVEIYPEVADLAKVSTLTLKEIETSGTIAICKFNRLMIVSPRALVHGYPWLDTLAHEFTHFVVTRLSRDTVPIWLHEGLAKFEERRWRLGDGEGGGLTPTMESLLATALGTNGKGGRRLITFDEMYPSMAKLPSQEDSALAFAEVYTVVEYLREKKGLAGMRQVIAHMRDGKGDVGAVADVLGVSFDEFQRGWKAWLKARKLRARPGLVPTSLKFAHGKTDRRDEEEDPQQIAEERARKFVRLGGMLRNKGRLAAATVEYEKAQALIGPGHFVVASRLARTWLALGEADKAIAAAAPAFDLYPESAGPAAILGEAWWKKKAGARAAPYLEAAIRVSPFDPLPHCALAEIYGGTGDPRAAREKSACRAAQ